MGKIVYLEYTSGTLGAIKWVFYRIIMNNISNFGLHHLAMTGRHLHAHFRMFKPTVNQPTEESPSEEVEINGGVRFCSERQVLNNTA